jgi:RNA polymerase sigma-70 factor (ECF subfamily)
MSATPVSLLARLSVSQDDVAWKQLVDLYDPLLRGWLRRQGVQPADADDVIQEVFRVVLAKIAHFQHNRQKGAFRSWLRLVMSNCLMNRWRARRAQLGQTGDDQAWQALEQLQDPGSELSRRWDEEHNQYVAHRFLQQVQEHFEPATCRAFHCSRR